MPRWPPELFFPPRSTLAPFFRMAVDKSEARVKRMFGEIAGRYDFLNHLLSMGVDHYWRWRTVRRVPPQSQEPILDLCTGTGDLALAYLRAGRGTTAVVGADFCHEMLVIGEAKRAVPAQAACSIFSRPTHSGCPCPMTIFKSCAWPLGCATSRTPTGGCAR